MSDFSFVSGCTMEMTFHHLPSQQVVEWWAANKNREEEQQTRWCRARNGELLRLCRAAKRRHEDTNKPSLISDTQLCTKKHKTVGFYYRLFYLYRPWGSADYRLSYRLKKRKAHGGNVRRLSDSFVSVSSSSVSWFTSCHYRKLCVEVQM